MKAKYVIAGALIWAVSVAAAVFITISLNNDKGETPTESKPSSAVSTESEASSAPEPETEQPVPNDSKPEGYYDSFPIYDIVTLDVSEDKCVMISDEPTTGMEYNDEDVTGLLQKGGSKGYEKQEQTIGDFKVRYFINRNIYFRERVSTYIFIEYTGDKKIDRIKSVHSEAGGHSLGFSFDETLDKDFENSLVLIANTNNNEGFSYNIDVNFTDSKGESVELNLQYK